jgi:hypothetical protein
MPIQMTRTDDKLTDIEKLAAISTLQRMQLETSSAENKLIYSLAERELSKSVTNGKSKSKNND